MDDTARRILARPARHAGIGIPNPTVSAAEQHEASKEITKGLTTALLERSYLDTTSYKQEASAARSSLSAERDKAHAESLKADISHADPITARRLERAKRTGLWLTTAPETLNGTELSPEEFTDNLRIRYGNPIPELPQKCDGCGANFSVDHALTCHKGGLILQRHNDLAKEWSALCSQALTPTAVTAEPLIHSGRTAAPEANSDSHSNSNANNHPDARGDVGAHGFWSRQRTTIFDIRITDTDAPSQRGTAPTKILARHEREKKAKYLQACLDRRQDFSPLVFSVDGLRGAEANAASKRLAALLSGKWRRTYSQVCGFVRSRLSIALARSASMCLRGCRDPTARSRHYTWEAGGAGLHLYN